eukprot:COSAG01_NODE_13752_length_1540_cov_210.030534_1_plen_78_part_00
MLQLLMLAGIAVPAAGRRSAAVERNARPKCFIDVGDTCPALAGRAGTNLWSVYTQKVVVLQVTGLAMLAESRARRLS